MHPVICKIGPFSVYAYGLMLVIAFLVSSILACKEARREGINPDLIFNLAFIVFICGIAGARIFYIIENYSFYKGNPAQIIMLQQGGLSWFGGLIFGFISGILYFKKKKLPIYKTLDLVAPFVALAQAIGRIGCLLNGCCFGKVSEFGIWFTLHQAVLIPTQLYSSLILIFIYITLRFLQIRPHKDGQIFSIYLFLYSLKRFFIEFWRADNPVILWGLTLFQLISIGVFCLSVLMLSRIIKTKK
jgi:phosphatidylglycerol:prolipoprotein diacylglycerol transferase